MGRENEQVQRFVSRISRVRQARGMTQQQAAEKAGMSRQALSLMEIGRQRVQLSDAITLSAALDVPLADMLSEAPLKLTVSVPID